MARLCNLQRQHLNAACVQDVRLPEAGTLIKKLVGEHWLEKAGRVT